MYFSDIKMIPFRLLRFCLCLFVLQGLFKLADSVDNWRGNDFFINNINIKSLIKEIIPTLDGKQKGESGKVGVIGGSIEYTGAPYFSAISALKTGADLVFVITNEIAAPIIKTYSPDLIVYPFLSSTYFSKLKPLLMKMDCIVIGPGLGRETDTIKLIHEIIHLCKEIEKPLVIDADGLYALSHNITIIKDYPSPGVIITPNHREAKFLRDATSNVFEGDWTTYWGEYVSTLVKGESDQFYSYNSSLSWTLKDIGSGRRNGGQGDILSGSLGTFYIWAFKYFCHRNNNTQLAQSIAAYAAAKLTRLSNFEAYSLYGRSMTASDMIPAIHTAFKEISQ